MMQNVTTKMLHCVVMGAKSDYSRSLVLVMRSVAPVINQHSIFTNTDYCKLFLTEVVVLFHQEQVEYSFWFSHKK